MVLKKRLDYGFNGCQIPFVPRAPRSVRKRGPRKKVEDSQICAFELLAAVAGKLLQENESSASSNASEVKDLLGIQTNCIKEKHVEEDNKASRSEYLDQGSCLERVFVPESSGKERSCKPILDDIPLVESDSLADHISNITSSHSSKKVDCELKLGVYNSKTVEGSSKVGGLSPVGDECNGRVEIGTLRQLEDDIKQSKNLTVANNCSVKKKVDKCMNSEQQINSDTSVQLSLYRDQLSSASFPKHRNDVNVGIRDDDENSFRCNKLSTKIWAFKPQARDSYGKFSRMLTSKYWKSAPKFRDYDLSNTNEGTNPLYHSRKRMRMRDRYLREAPIKKRILYERSFVVEDDQDNSSESISNSPEKGIKGYKCSSDAIFHSGHRMSTSVKAHKMQKASKVKLSIKSFKVPELYIEVPETETIGTLKRTVMETVTAILGGGLRVGMVVQGKKVRDDNRTLQQAGIYSSNLDTLAFILEPSFTPVAETSRDSAHLCKSIEEQKLIRSTANNILDSGLTDAIFHPPLLTEMDYNYDNNHVIVPSTAGHTDALTDEARLVSKALVPVPAPDVEPLSTVPMNQKSKRAEMSQRRTRRPFSVAEVEALVEAVEVLGTGRWRDVKMRAFENADHRTYVDLKDKWKTLVHTASISSQQRRGEPVPQDLLDRVLTAHAYWTQHQSKPHGKHHAEPLKAVEARRKPLEV